MLLLCIWISRLIKAVNILIAGFNFSITKLIKLFISEELAKGLDCVIQSGMVLLRIIDLEVNKSSQQIDSVFTSCCML